MIENFPQLASAPADLLWTTLVAIIVSAIVTSLMKTSEKRKSAEIDYEYEQKKILKTFIGGYHGRLVAAASELHIRIKNLHANDKKGWINVGGEFDKENYYFNSTVHRFMAVVCLLRQIEKEAIHLDARIASNKDFDFLNYVSAMRWIMVDTANLVLINKSNEFAHDHFFADMLTKYAESLLIDGEFPSFEDFQRECSSSSAIKGVLQYFDGITKEENRVRWDRLVCLDLLLVGFLNSFGYPRHRSSREKILGVAEEFYHEGSVGIFLTRIPDYDLSENRGMRDVIGGLIEFNRRSP